MNVRSLIKSVVFAAMLLLLCLASSVPAKAFQRGDRLRGVAKVSSEKSPDAELEKAILRALQGYSPEPGQEVRYYYNRVDLNGDGRPEAIVHLVSPLICGTGGCETLIFQPARGGYRLISSISLTNNPIVVSTRKTRGWNDLIIYVVGGGILPGHYATLRFNGRTYPNNATDAPALAARARISGTAYIADDVTPDNGLTLRYGGR